MASMLNTLFNVGFKKKTTETTGAELSAASTARVEQEKVSASVYVGTVHYFFGGWDMWDTCVSPCWDTPPRTLFRAGRTQLY